MSSLPPVIVHYHAEWLPPTMTWLHEQITQLQQHADNHIMCEHEIQGNPFQIKNLHPFNSIPRFRQYLQRFVKKTGITSHLLFYETIGRAVGANVLHAHFGHMGTAMLPVSQRLQIPLVVTFYGMDVHQLPKSFPAIRKGYKDMFSGVSRVLCEGEYMAKDVVKLGCDPQKVRVHRLGINLDNTPFQLAGSTDRAETRILIAASFREKKGIPLALNAVAALRDRYKLKVTVIGDAGSDSASQREKRRILEVIESNRMHDIVHMAGFASHDMLKRTARDHDIFLSPSLHASDGDCEGGAPVTIIEMAASGLIVVSSNHCDIPGVIRASETGFLAQEASLDDLIHNLSLAVESRDNWGQIATASRKHIETNFDARKQAQQLLTHYTEVVHAFR